MDCFKWPKGGRSYIRKLILRISVMFASCDKISTHWPTDTIQKINWGSHWVKRHITNTTLYVFSVKFTPQNIEGGTGSGKIYLIDHSFVRSAVQVTRKVELQRDPLQICIYYRLPKFCLKFKILPFFANYLKRSKSAFKFSGYGLLSGHQTTAYFACQKLFFKFRTGSKSFDYCNTKKTWQRLTILSFKLFYLAQTILQYDPNHW